MQREMELQQIIFHIIETQIKFGGHRYGDQLPTLREASSYFLASLDTVRLAYLRLKREGRGQGDGAVAGGGRGKIKRSGFLSEFH